MTEPTPINALLRKKFDELRARNPQISLRAFAERVGLSSGALSEVLSGKRPLSEKKVRSLIRMKLFDPAERNELARAAGFVLAMDRGRKRPVYSKLSREQVHIIADWWHFAILSLMKTKDFKSDAKWIAERIGVDFDLVRSAVFRLKEMGHIIEKDGVWTRTSEAVTTPDDRADLIQQRGNLGLIQLAGRRLKSVPHELRDVTSYVMAIHPNRLPQAKQAIRRFQDELSEILEHADATEVYQLGIQLFPISRPPPSQSS